ncbi:class I mannose-6-phosphate isomerase [Novosphingobium sp. KCTC 2891]|uniref:class I mannose-6-phosphate isomerase n=1 Tax=Novosphingobium sp. KCTC 2891 TaxID=2989730 RepID=UPI002222B8EC|nr:class I mannose-6-phosphate isomerase [Novosphingobium sp. KCTC 2891]MCW1383841.1 class I mannose-6-phosphate isomerase [Novosphingobium sp. KCTC 2891]
MSKLPIRTVEKPWGKDVLPAPFSAPGGQRIGEIWFEPPPEVPSLLIKYIFTSEKLSVQVHPSDEQAAASGETEATGYGGKEECWLVIDAEPGATLGVGFTGPVDAATMRAAALDGSIEDMLVWHPVGPGDFFYIPANTVHAIGAGVSLIEIQQNSDITYRLYDYGRPRELHLDKGIAVSKGEALDPGLRKHIPETGTVELARGRYFTAHRVDGLPGDALRAEYDGPLLVIPRKGQVLLADQPIAPGDCASAPNIAALTLPADGQYILVRAAG